MPDSRKIIFANNEIYHLFNRGIDRRPIFRYKKEYQQFLNLLQYYQFDKVPFRFSRFTTTQRDERINILKNLFTKTNKRVSIIAFSLMPNHFHLVVRQNTEKGITHFMADISNSYTKYFNAKAKRVGPLLQGLFKAVHVETTEQLIHVGRYVHLNPVVSNIIKISDLDDYPYTSHKEYVVSYPFQISEPGIILSQFKSVTRYKEFINDQVEFGMQLEKIKHLIFE